MKLHGILTQSEFHLLGLLKKHFGDHRCQTDAEVQEAFSQSFHSKSPEFYALGTPSMITM
jgi:hypothetical protein